MSSMSKTAAACMRTFSPDAAPAVLASSRLCELMEMAAARLMRPQLGAGQASVSVETKLEHLAVAFGSRGPVRVAASHHSSLGRLHHFVVDAFDESGLIAVCEHTRAVVNRRRFMAISRKRAGQLSMLLEV